MTQPNFRRVQKGNPHQLTINQHIHAAHCIKNFSDEKGRIAVFDKSISQWIKRKPDAAIFCAKRAWDQHSEKGYMNRIEVDFFNVIDSINTPFNERMHDDISRYYHLWRLRGLARDKERRDVYFNKALDHRLTINQQEILEGNGYSFIAENDVMPHHIASSIEIKVMLGKACHLIEPIKWGLLTASKGEFIVADYYPGDSIGLEPFIPISPQYAFFANTLDKNINVKQVREFNRVSIASSTNYYFCRDIDRCPF